MQTKKKEIRDEGNKIEKKEKRKVKGKKKKKKKKERKPSIRVRDVPISFEQIFD